MSIKGYVTLSDEQKSLMNVCKELEEQVLRQIDILVTDPITDKRHLAISKTNIEQAFMWMNRSIAKPERLT